MNFRTTVIFSVALMLLGIVLPFFIGDYLSPLTRHVAVPAIFVVAIVLVVVGWFRRNDVDSSATTSLDLSQLPPPPPPPPARLQPVVPDWKPRLLQMFKGKVDIYGGLTYFEPTIQVEGAFKLSPQQQHKASLVAANLVRKGNDDQIQLVLGDNYEEWRPERYNLDEKADWARDPVTLRVNTIKYSAVKSFRADRLCVPTLSANAILVCPQSRQLVLQRRSPEMDTYPNGVHNVGDGHQHHWPGGDSDLYATMRREVLEELGVQADDCENLPKAILGELDTGFIQVNYLGVEISSSNLQKMATETKEGSNFAVSFDKLEEELRKDPSPEELKKDPRKEKWVPTGRAAILIWLAFGAPYPSKGREPVRFGGKTAEQLFNAIVPG